MRDAATAALAHVVRGGFVESVHAGHAVVVAPDGAVAFAAGEPEVEIIPRSAAKPLQALASLTAGASLQGETLAIACASHAGEPYHVGAVDRLLAVAGLDRAALGNVADWPLHAPSRHALVREMRGPEPVFMNCSGKHAGMLAGCVANGWPTGAYRDAGHPLQQRIVKLMADKTGTPVHRVVVDGCGAPCPGTTLAGLARALSCLMTRSPDTPERQVVDAMRDHPAHIAGTGRGDTRLMELVPGAVAKGGAEGVLVVALADGTTAAVKCGDGANRPAMAVAVAALRSAGARLQALPELELVPVFGGGRRVGRVEVTVGDPATEQELS